MKTIIKTAKWTIGILLAGYLAVCGYFYFAQESIIFPAKKLPADYQFVFTQNFEERKLQMTDGTRLDGLLFRSDSSRGLIFYLHGNAGSLETWGKIASAYTQLHYDIFMADYRGYGKSEGKIISEEEVYSDEQALYNSLKKEYPENKIVILGYSIGTGPASWLASRNHPKMLILQAPYFNLTDLSQKTYPFLPGFLLKYKFQTNDYLSKTSAPILIIHGNEDEVIYYGSSLKLQKCFKPGDKLIILKGQTHNGFTHNPDYLSALQSIL